MLAESRAFRHATPHNPEGAHRQLASNVGPVRQATFVYAGIDVERTGVLTGTRGRQLEERCPGGISPMSVLIRPQASADELHFGLALDASIA